jgi:hypothetical protein
MNAEQIRKLASDNVVGHVDASLDEANLRNVLLGEIAAQLAEMNEQVCPYKFTKFEDWFDLWDTTRDPEVRRLCKVSWDVSRYGR